MTIQDRLIEKYRYFPPIDTLKRLGYRHISNKTLDRLERVFVDEDLGFSKSGCDFKFSNIEFIEALCTLFGIDVEANRSELDDLLRRDTLIRQAFRSYIYVDTGFVRTSQPIFALAAMEGIRNLVVPRYVRLCSLSEQVMYVANFIRNHYQETCGQLPLWGVINQYVYFYASNTYVVLNPKGDIIDNKDVTINKAALLLGSQKILDR